MQSGTGQSFHRASRGILMSGEVSEWLMVPLSKSGVRKHRGFESLPLRHTRACWIGPSVRCRLRVLTRGTSSPLARVLVSAFGWARPTVADLLLPPGEVA